MKKQDIIKTVISAAIIIALAVFIVNINKIISPKIPTKGEKLITPVTGEAVTDYGDCFREDSSTVVFVHSNSCPYCNSIKPIIEELEKDGYKFYWAESSDSEAKDMISNCFSDLLSGYVPQFICPKTGKEQTGAMSKAELKKFADSCI